MKKLLLLLSLLSPITSLGASGGGKVDASYIEAVRQGSAPSAPASGKARAYVLDSDGKFYVKNSSNTAKACTYSGDIVNADLSGSAGITNANLASMSQSTFKCRTTASTGAPEDCTATQAQAIVGSVPQVLAHQTTPSNPASGYVKFYVKSTGVPYILDSSGVETALATGSSGRMTLVYSKYTSGSDTWTPSETGRYLVKFAGGGGGGSGGGDGSNLTVGGGGGQGSACIAIINVASTSGHTIDVGTGGSKGNGNTGGPTTSAPGSAGNDTTITNPSATVIARCKGGKGGIGGVASVSTVVNMLENRGGPGGQPSCASTSGVAGAAGNDGGYTQFDGTKAPGAGAAGSGDTGGTCGGGGGGAGMFGAGGAGGGTGACTAGTNGSAGGGGGGGGSSGHPSVCAGSNGGDGGVGGIEIYSL